MGSRWIEMHGSGGAGYKAHVPRKGSSLATGVNVVKPRFPFFILTGKSQNGWAVIATQRDFFALLLIWAFLLSYTLLWKIIKTVEVWRVEVFSHKPNNLLESELIGNAIDYWFFFFCFLFCLERESLLSVTFWKSVHWRWRLSNSLITFACLVARTGRTCLRGIKASHVEGAWLVRS